MEVKINSAQEKIVRILDEKVVSPERLAELMGRGWTAERCQNAVLTLTRKGLINKTKACLFLRGTKMIKFIEKDFGSALIGGVPKGRMR